MKGIILFDGVCNFCNQSVQFIIKRDPSGYFQFTPLQSDVGQRLLKRHNVPEHVDSIVLIDNGKPYVKSSAALRICKNLHGAWKILYIFLFTPRSIRDYFYDFFAKNRYKWFGKQDSCMLPSPEIRKRFLD